VFSSLGRVAKLAAKWVREKGLELRYPYLRVLSMPEDRPSIRSIYFLANQLGRSSPVGLTHRPRVAYHELPFQELELITSRDDLAERIARISRGFEFGGKFGLDIGSAVGGMSFALQQEGAQMLGVERDRPSLDLAQECEAYFQTGAVFSHSQFSVASLPELLDIGANPLTNRFDFAIWMSSFNWVANDLEPEEMAELVSKLSSSVDVLFADSAIGGKGSLAMQKIGIGSNDDFCKYVMNNSEYTKVVALGTDTGWYQRQVFRFEK